MGAIKRMGSGWFPFSGAWKRRAVLLGMVVLMVGALPLLATDRSGEPIFTWFGPVRSTEAEVILALAPLVMIAAIVIGATCRRRPRTPDA